MGRPLRCCLTHHDCSNTAELSLAGGSLLVCALPAVLPSTGLVEGRREGGLVEEEGGRKREEEGGRKMVQCL